MKNLIFKKIRTKIKNRKTSRCKKSTEITSKEISRLIHSIPEARKFEEKNYFHLKITVGGQNLVQNQCIPYTNVQILVYFRSEAQLWPALALRWLGVRRQTRYLRLSEARDLFISGVYLGFAARQIIQNGVGTNSYLHIVQIRDVSHPN